MSFQDDTNSLVFWTSGFVARSLRIAADMRLAHASLAGKIPAATCHTYFLTGP
jgi:hypothetical protein